jgi:hypothetical protein
MHVLPNILLLLLKRGNVKLYTALEGHTPPTRLLPFLHVLGLVRIPAWR